MRTPRALLAAAVTAVTAAALAAVVAGAQKRPSTSGTGWTTSAPDSSNPRAGR
ncbi:hypothetical protein [Streptomyces pseudogriseolus]|uniref:hypothetical protein n=1 Tax=Streptomyces pseudogriseolus TaxID=36817 RepID=UPI0034723E26